VSRTAAGPSRRANPGGARLLDDGGGRARADRSAVATAAGTAVSRLTGLLRLVMVAYALGGERLGDAFNLANNTPNMIHDLVLGGILAATFVPVFVDRIARATPRAAEESIAAVITCSAVLLLVATLLFEALAPAIIDLYTFGASTPAEHALAVTLLRWFAPQLACYGAISLISALLATRHRFAAVGIAPVVNNLVGIAVLGAFAAIAGTHASGPGALGWLQQHPDLVVLLGLGTTAGVALQALALWPSLRRSGIRLRPLWRPGDPAVRTIIELSGWTLGFVAANQLAVFVVLALEFHTGPGGVSAYTYAYTFFQLPFGIVAVSVVNVATPALARAASSGRSVEVGARFGTAARQVLALVLPATVGYLVLAQPIVSLVIGHGAELAGGGAQARATAATLAMFALGLPAFCVYLLAIRAFQAMQDTRTAFVLYVLENAVNILVALVLYRTPLGVRGLALSYSIAYSVAVVAALAVLRERLGTIGGRAIWRAGLRSVLLSVMMAVAVALVQAATGNSSGVIGWLRLALGVLTGLVVYLGGAGCAAAVSAWQTSRRHGGGRQLAPNEAPMAGHSVDPQAAADRFRTATRQRAASQRTAAAQSGSTRRSAQLGTGSRRRGSRSDSVDRGGRHRQRRRPPR